MKHMFVNVYHIPCQVDIFNSACLYVYIFKKCTPYDKINVFKNRLVAHISCCLLTVVDHYVGQSHGDTRERSCSGFRWNFKFIVEAYHENHKNWYLTDIYDSKVYYSWKSWRSPNLTTWNKSLIMFIMMFMLDVSYFKCYLNLFWYIVGHTPKMICAPTWFCLW